MEICFCLCVCVLVLLIDMGCDGPYISRFNRKQTWGLFLPVSFTLFNLLHQARKHKTTFFFSCSHLLLVIFVGFFFFFLVIDCSWWLYHNRIWNNNLTKTWAWCSFQICDQVMWRFVSGRYSWCVIERWDSTPPLPSCNHSQSQCVDHINKRTVLWWWVI